MHEVGIFISKLKKENFFFFHLPQRFYFGIFSGKWRQRGGGYTVCPDKLVDFDKRLPTRVSHQSILFFLASGVSGLSTAWARNIISAGHCILKDQLPRMVIAIRHST